MPGLDVKPLLDELRDRVAEELDYRRRGAGAARVRRRRSTATPTSSCPTSSPPTEHVLVTEWMDGTPLSKIISDGTQEQRDRAGLLLVRFLFSGPARPGCCTPTRIRATSGCSTTAGSACSTSARSTGCPTGCRRSSASCCGSCTPTATSAMVERSCAGDGFLRPGVEVDLEALRALPRAARRAVPGGGRSSSAGSGCAARPRRVTDLRPRNVARQLNLPPSYVLIHRVLDRRASACCASWSARARSAPRCCAGFPATPTTTPRAAPPPSPPPDPRRPASGRTGRSRTGPVSPAVI